MVIRHSTFGLNAVTQKENGVNMHVLDIRFDSSDPVASALSNLTPREFTFRGVPCGSIEGVLQGVKTGERGLQQAVCRKSGLSVVKIYKGAFDQEWQRSQKLKWQGEVMTRGSDKYAHFITELFDTVFEQDYSYREALLQSWPRQLTHSIGKYCQTKTVLTQMEFLYQTLRLREVLCID